MQCFRLLSMRDMVGLDGNSAELYEKMPYVSDTVESFVPNSRAFQKRCKEKCSKPVIAKEKTAKELLFQYLENRFLFATETKHVSPESEE